MALRERPSNVASVYLHQGWWTLELLKPVIAALSDSPQTVFSTLQSHSREFIETIAEDGLYIVKDWPGPKPKAAYDPERDEFRPCGEMLARVKTKGEIPRGVELCTARSDGKLVIYCWDVER